MAGPESKYAHAAERVFSYMLYRMEELSRPQGFDPTQYSIAKDCARGKGRPCNLNEFVTFVSGGTNSGVPALTKHLPNLSTNWYHDKDKIEDVIRRFAEAPDMDRTVNAQLASGNILEFFDRNAQRMKGSNYINLYMINYPNLMSELQARLQALPDTSPRRIEARGIGNQLVPLLESMIKLRKAYQLNQMEEEMRKLFPDNRNDVVYRVDSNKNAINPQLEPIKWHYHEGTNFAGKTIKALDFTATENDPANARTCQHFETKIKLLKQRVFKGTAGDGNINRQMQALRTHEPVIKAMSSFYTKWTGKTPEDLC
ncbi:hypothetical protein QBC41DRAFT_236070 [Cercophora samala]|uniref:Uncharacterized protein n=1 Tax=Cercophora samala TaxID=330535 RepID=A0AA40D326_9PEZI|nr:hypothetical protein QBC41DRAFT_236070 [Cercophora samala]